MANDTRCVFCGKSISPFRSTNVLCGKTYEPSCLDCSKEMEPRPHLDRCRRALQRGLANQPELLREYIEVCESAEERRPKCLRCGGEMLRRGRQQFKLGEETFFFSDINRLASGSMTLEILRCESCGKMEFYDPALFSPEDN